MPRVRLDGGLIGVTNNPTSGSAGGMWSFSEHSKYTRSSGWPAASNPVNSVNAIVAMIGGGGGSTGGVASVNYGAGGAGGVLRYANSNILTNNPSISYTVTVGAGGTGVLGSTPGSGSNSTFSASAVIATGGGGVPYTSLAGANNADFSGAAGTGGVGSGGGAGAAANGSGNNGGAGANIAISGTFTSYGGGGAGVNASSGGGTGGAGGGGAGQGSSGVSATSGTAGTGGGAGGGPSNATPANGGSGVVIINYPAPQQYTGGTITNVNNLAGSNIVHTFTTSGTLTALSTPIDTYFPQTTLLLHGDGTSGANNTVFLDGSTNNLTITTNGKPQQGTFSPFSQTGWSNYFNGSSSYLTTNTSPAFDLSTPTSWTIEWWMYPILNQKSYIIQNYTTSGTPIYGLDFGYDAGLVNIGTYNGSSAGLPQLYLTYPVANNTWTHVAAVRNGSGANNITLYVNGVAANTATYTSWPAPGNSTTYIGARNYTGVQNYFGGYISNLRSVIGTALYTGNFIPPAAPLATIANTALLTCANNTFIGANSTVSNVTITTAGTPSVQPFSPFSPSSAYSNTAIGGSIYFNGSTDYLTNPSTTISDFGTNNFTVEAWIYPLAVGTSAIIYDGRSTGGNGQNFTLILGSTSGKITVLVNGATQYTSTATLVTNQWYHIAVVRSGTSTNQTAVYINGALDGTFTNSTVFVNGYNVIGAAAYTPVGAAPFSGYISNLRIVKGTAVYTAAFTPPTAPLTAITNTSLLLNATNAGIIDNTGKNVLTTYGSAAISSTQSKFGGTSMYFNGTTDYILMPSSPRNIIGTSSCTVEFWMYPSDLTTTRRLISSSSGNFTSGTFVIRFQNITNLVAGVWGAGTAGTNYVVASSQPTINSWNHVAWVGTNGTSQQLFINGVSVGTAGSYNATEAIQFIGGYYSTGPAEFFSGYLDDIRITQGVARYTTNFTPPTSAFLNQ